MCVCVCVCVCVCFMSACVLLPQRSYDNERIGALKSYKPIQHLARYVVVVCFVLFFCLFFLGGDLEVVIVVLHLRLLGIIKQILQCLWLLVAKVMYNGIHIFYFISYEEFGTETIIKWVLSETVMVDNKTFPMILCNVRKGAMTFVNHSFCVLSGVIFFWFLHIYI